jgi:TP901 family phage tail tape measure protein
MTPWRTISVALRGDASSLIAATTAGSASVKRFGTDTETSLARADGAANRTRSTWQTLTSVMAIGIAGVGIALGLSLREAIAWESAFAGVAKTVDGTTAQLADLEDGLLSLALRLPATRTEIAGVAEAAGALGVERENILGFTEVMIGLGEATNLTADEAATMLAQFGNIMGTPQAAVESLADSLVNLGNNGASTEREILDMALRLAGAGATIGLTEDQVLALSNALASMGVPAELGGGAVSRVLSKIEVSVADGSDALVEFAEAAGLTAQEFAAAWEADPGAAFENFIGSLAKLQDEGANVIGILKELGIKGTQERDVMLRLISGHEGLAQSMDDVTESAGALADEVDKRYATAESQLRIFGNQVSNVARIVGAELIPLLLAGLDAARQFGEWVQRVGADVGERLEPAWRSLVGAGENLVSLFVELRAVAEPAAEIMAKIAGGAVIASFTALAQALETTTGFLADHEGAVTGVAVAYVTLKAATSIKFAALWIATWPALSTVMSSITTGLLTMAGAAQAAQVSIGANGFLGALKALPNGMQTVVSKGGAVGAALAAIAIGAAGATWALDKLHDAGREAGEALLMALGPEDNSSLDSMAARSAKLLELRREIQEEIDSGSTSRFQDQQLLAELQVVDAALEKNNDSLLATAGNLRKFGDETGLTGSQVQDLARSLGLDLPEAFDESGKPVPELVKEYERLVDVSEGWGITVSDAAQKSRGEIMLLEESIARIDEAGRATGEAWSAWANLLQITDNPVDQDAVDNSAKILDDARDRVAEAQAEANASGQSAEEAERTARALEDARDALREATDSHAELLASDSPLNAEKVQAWYAERLTEASTFTENLNAAIAAGYDPALITRLMQAGPEAAGPVLEALVSDTSASYVESINAAETALAEFTTFAVRQAQLTQRAIEVGTRQAAEDLATALAIEQQAMLDPTLTGNEIAERLGLELEDAQRVVDTFDLDVEVYASAEQAALQLRDFTNEERMILMGVDVDTDPADEELDGLTNEQRIALIGAEADTDEAETDLDNAARTRTMRIVAITDPESQRLIDSLSIGATLAANSGSNRWGGVTHYATGGIHRYAMVGTGRGRVHWDEPATGGEAYVPRRGSKWRSLAVLSEAAGWYGMEVVPKAANQQPPMPARVPYGGALVPAATGDGARGAGRGDTQVNIYETTSPRVTAGEVQTVLGFYG